MEPIEPAHLDPQDVFFRGKGTLLNSYLFFKRKERP